MAMAPLFLAIGLALAAPASASDKPADDALADYRAQLSESRDDQSWLGSQLSEFRKYPYLDRAYRRYSAGHYDDAAAQLNRLLEIDPDDQSARLMLVQMRLQQGGHQTEVIEVADQLLAARPNFAPAYLYRGLAKRQQGKQQAASKDLQQALDLDGLSSADQRRARGALADTAFELGQHQLLLNTLRNGGSGDAHADAWRTAQAQLGLGRHSEAIVTLHEAVRLAPDDSSRHFTLRLLARALESKGDHAGAESALRRILAVEDSAATALRLADLQAENGRTEAALATLKQLIARRPAGDAERVQAWRRSGVLHSKRGEWQMADRAYAAAYEESDRKDPALLDSLAVARQRASGDRAAARLLESAYPFSSYPEAARKTLNQRLAVLQQGAGKNDHALELLRDLYRRGEADRESERQLGELLRAAGECDEGMRRTVGAKASGPLNGPLSLRAASCYREADKDQLALRYARQSRRQIQQLNADEYHQLANLFEAYQDDAAALAVLQRLLGVQRSAARARTLQHIAVIHTRQQNWTPAADAYLAAFKVAPNDPAPLSSAAHVHQQAGDAEAAIALLQQHAPFAGMPAAGRLQLSRQLATLLDLQGDTGAAIKALETQLAKSRPADKASQLMLSRLYHKAGDCERALPASQASLQLGAAEPGEHLLQGLCYQQLGNRPLAIEQLQQELNKGTALSDAERQQLHSSLARLYSAEGDQQLAADHWAKASSLGKAPSVTLGSAGNARRSGDAKAAQEMLASIDPAQLRGAELAEYHDEMANQKALQSDIDGAIASRRQALAAAPNAYRHALLAELLSLRDPSSDEALEQQQRAIELAPTQDHYRASLAYLYVGRGEDENAIAVFSELQDRRYGGNRYAEDIAHAHKRLGNTREAASWFRRAIDQQHEAAATLASSDSNRSNAEDAADAYRLKSEVAGMERPWRFNLNANLRSRSSDGKGASSAVEGGSLISQGGVEIGYRPDGIGHRGGRLLEVVGRGFWNFDEGSLKVLRESVQGGIGVRYQPLPEHNVFVAGERLVAIGDNARNDWMLRASASFDKGTGFEAGEDSWLYRSVYVDVARTLDAGETFYGAQGKLGWAQRLGNNHALIWHGTLAANGSESDGNRQDNAEAGVGVTFKGWYDEDRYSSHLWRLEGGLEYREVISGDEEGEDSVLMRLGLGL